ECSTSNAYLIVRFCDATFPGGDVGSTLKETRRHPDWDRGKVERNLRPWRYVELGGRLADQCCDGVLVLRAHHSNIGILNLCSVKLCSRLSHICRGRRAPGD